MIETVPALVNLLVSFDPFATDHEAIETGVRDAPAGSVIIAGPQCLVTTLTVRTGWSIIGRSPTQVLTGDPDAPFLFDVGDRVTFERIDAATFARLSKARENG